VPYWSRIRVSLSTLTKLPLIKYTPFWIWNDDPVCAASFDKVTPKGAPALIALFPKRPEEIISLHANSSESLNTSVELFALLEFK